jgi:hypothetical protein
VTVVHWFGDHGEEYLVQAHVRPAYKPW